MQHVDCGPKGDWPRRFENEEGASRLSASVRRVNDLPIQARIRSVIDGTVHGNNGATMKLGYAALPRLTVLCALCVTSLCIHVLWNAVTLHVHAALIYAANIVPPKRASDHRQEKCQ